MRRSIRGATPSTVVRASFWKGWTLKRTISWPSLLKDLDVECVQRRAAGAGVDFYLDGPNAELRHRHPFTPTDQRFRFSWRAWHACSSLSGEKSKKDRHQRARIVTASSWSVAGILAGNLPARDPPESVN